MADDIVQTIKIEVEGADQAAGEIQKVGKATEDVQKTAAKTAGGTQELGKGLDQVSDKSRVSFRELKALSKVAHEFGADFAVAGLGLVRMAAILGPLGAGLFALGEAISFVGKKMKEAQEQAKNITATFANIAKVSAESKLEKEAAFWGTTAAEIKKAANDIDRVADQLRKGGPISPLTTPETLGKAFVQEMERAGISLDNIRADTKGLSADFQKTVLLAAQFTEKLSPLQRVEFLKGLKGLGPAFSDDVIKNIEKGAEAVKKAQAAADRFKLPPEAAATIKEMQEDFSKLGDTASRAGGDIVTWFGLKLKTIFVDLPNFIRNAFSGVGLDGFGDALVRAVDTSMAQVKQIVAQAYNAVVQFVTQAPGAAWQWIVATFNAAVAAVTSAASSVAASIVAFVTEAPGDAWQWIADTAASVWEQVPTLAGQAYQSVVSFVTTPVANAWEWLKDTLQSVLDELAAKWARFKQSIGLGGGAPAPAAAAGGQFAGGGLLGGRGTGTSDSNLAWVSRGEYIMPARAVAQPGVLAFLEALRGNSPRFAGGGLVPAYAGGGQVEVNPSTLISKLRQVGDILVNVAETASKNASTMDDVLRGIASNAFDALNKASFKVRDMANAVDKTLVSAVEMLKSIIQDLDKAAGGKAAGGLLGGRGTGTSDSNLAWVSRGEHIMPARAVSQPGVLALLEALRRSGGNLRGVLDGMGRFALGGMVRAPLAIPAFAGGGMNNVTIQFPGLPEITGLRASSAVVDELRKAAALAQVRSGGRKPSRYS